MCVCRCGNVKTCGVFKEKGLQEEETDSDEK